MIEWQTNPNLGTYIELQTIIPVILKAEDDFNPSASIAYSLQSEINFLSIDGNTLSGIVGELDDWYYEVPEDFSYDTEDTYGGNYAKFGSGLAGTTNVQFTIRAYEIGNESNFSDQIFTISVRNNYSSDRDRMVLEHISKLDLKIDGKIVTAEEFLNYYKSLGYYI